MEAEVAHDSGPVLSEDPLAAYLKYPFDTDPSYQQGLASLIAEGRIDLNSQEEQRAEALRRTRVFYFNRVSGLSVTVEAVRNHELSKASTGTSSDSTVSSTETNVAPSSDDTRVLTFAELQELIESGKTDQIPNNKVIPNLLNENTPSESSASIRRKPWEKADPVVT